MGPGRFVDSQGLFSAPEFASAVAWSEDNVLACAQGSSVSLLHPGALDGPRAYTSPIQPGEWSEIGNLRFSGLCHGTVYQAILELTDPDGRTTVWGDGSDVTAWHVSSQLAIPPLAVPVDIGFVPPGAVHP